MKGNRRRTATFVLPLLVPLRFLVMHLAIIGNGITGVTCARYVRTRDPNAQITLISDETDHFFSRTALMYIYMGHMTAAHTKPYEDRFWAENGLDLVRDRVTHIDPETKTLTLRDGAPLTYDVLLIASGSTPAFYDWPGQDLDAVQGLYGMPDLESMERWTAGIDRAAIVGGGLIGIEMAEMLRTRGIDVTFLVREPWYMNRVLPEEEGRMVEREILHHGIDLRLGVELKAVLGDDTGRARAVVTSEDQEVPVQFVGITTGVTPNIAFLEGSGIDTERGVLVDGYFRTSVPDVYAAGDCAQFREPLPGRRAIDQLWYTGREHGATLAHTITGTPRAYAPGVFYNSAKFFDIEYQTYGRIDPTPPDGETTLYWEAPDGRRAIRLQYQADGDRRIVGFNLMGVRYRHAVCADWIARGLGVETVLGVLGEANFDPEFFEQAEAAVVAAFNAKHGTALSLRTRRGWRSWMARLPMNGTTPHSLKDALAHVP